MPRKVRLPADAAQNRENQQRSRARRKAYVASLEARVREFESREVQATLEMQRAAREVTWVNERLMEMLAARGVARGEVDEFMRQRKEEEGGYGAAAGMCAYRDSKSRVVSTRDTGAPHSTCKGAQSGKESEHRHNQARSSDANGRDASVGADTQGAVDEHRTLVCDGIHRTPNQLFAPNEESRALLTSCDDAASIIADFQGHGDVSHARLALGCGDATNCHVKNTRLFQLMEEGGCS